MATFRMGKPCGLKGHVGHRFRFSGGRAARFPYLLRQVAVMGRLLEVVCECDPRSMMRIRANEYRTRLTGFLLFRLCKRRKGDFPDSCISLIKHFFKSNRANPLNSVSPVDLPVPSLHHEHEQSPSSSVLFPFRRLEVMYFILFGRGLPVEAFFILTNFETQYATT